ncbi:MAG: DUF4249 domain-containing protein [Bacteroidota bacterium]|nr:DUF4249 domain-containing protein [Bacteroidota bacterium]
MRLIKLIIFILIISIQSCIDPFIPETTRYDNVLFIECLLSNDTTQKQMVKISYSVPIMSESGSTGSNIPVKATGANVQVVRDDQEHYSFPEVEPGHYLASDMIPEAGRAYRLIVMYNGNIFESDFENMRASPPIDSITYKHTLDRLSETGDVYDGYRFYASTHEEEDGPSYYRWESVGTYLFKIPHEATHIWNGYSQIPASNRDVTFCWTTKVINGIYTGDTEGLSQNKIIEAPLHFESQYGDALSIRYSLNVKQFAITNNAWTFWSDMVRQVNQNGGMYDTQPFRIQGNIRCITDPELFVAGIFEVAGYSEARIFLNQPTEFDIIPVVCPMDTIGTEDLPWYQIPTGSFITYDGGSGEYFYSSPKCYDCTLKNGTTKKPAFWEDGI